MLFAAADYRPLSISLLEDDYDADASISLP